MHVQEPALLRSLHSALEPHGDGLQGVKCSSMTAIYVTYKILEVIHGLNYNNCLLIGEQPANGSPV